MVRLHQSSPQANTDPRQELILEGRFDYTPLAADVAMRVQTAAQRIRLLVQRTMEDILATGQELLAVKEALPHGQFRVWLHAEFDWNQRTAERFMAVAQRFGSKIDTMSIIKIDPTAAYLLAAPSAPLAASEIALERAENGERITVSVAKGILGTLGKKPVRRGDKSPALPDSKLLGHLLETLESLRRCWHPRLHTVLARQLRDFADSLEEKQSGS